MTTLQNIPPAYASNPANAASPTAVPNDPTTAGTALNSDFETFLKMLTVQMQNQDPLNPVDSSDYAVQLATFSSVEQQVLSNDLLRALNTQMGTMGMSQLAGWVGMEARAPAPAYFDGFPVHVATDPATGADAANLVVRNEDGDIVQRIAIPTSPETVQWEGFDATDQLFPSGNYTFEVESLLLGEVINTNTAETYSRITEARMDGGQTLLMLSGGGIIAASQISALREPV